MSPTKDSQEPLDHAFESPEDAAMSGWQATPGAQARVVDVHRRTDDEVLVIIQLAGGVPGFHDRDACVCVRGPNGKWREAGSTGL